MPDNVGYTPGTGATVAADEVGGVLYQRIKPAVGPDGTAVDVSESNPMPVAGYGELIEAIEALRMTVASLSRALNASVPDERGRQRVVAESAVLASGTLTTCSTVTTCSSVTNLSQIGAVDARSTVNDISRFAADSLRRNISVT